MPITVPPTAPTTTDPENFAVNMDAFLAWLVTFATALATEATLYALSVTGTSVTSLSVGTGAKALVTQTGKGYVDGMPVLISRTSAPTSYMLGQVTGYVSGTGALNVSVTQAPNVGGPFTDWTISPAILPDLSNLTITGVTFNGAINEGSYAIPSSTTPVLEPDNNFVQNWTLTGNSSPTESFAANQSMLLCIDDGSAYSISAWPSVTWKTDGGSAPNLNTSGYTFVLLVKVGSTLYGFRLGNA